MPLCWNCQRPSRGLGFNHALIKQIGEPQRFCSRICLETYKELRMDWTPKEDERIIEAGQRAGQYLEEINKFDLRRLSRDEWLGFLRTFIARHAELESKYREIWEEMAEEASRLARMP